MPSSTADARAALDALQKHEAWAVIRRSTRAGDRDTAGLTGGRRSEVDSLLDVPLEEGAPLEGHIADRLLAEPFRQVAERGIVVHAGDVRHPLRGEVGEELAGAAAEFQHPHAGGEPAGHPDLRVEAGDVLG